MPWMIFSSNFPGLPGFCAILRPAHGKPVWSNQFCPAKKKKKKWAEAWYHSISPHCWLDSWYVSRYYLHYVWLINAIKKGTDIKTCRTFFSGGMNIYFSDQGSRALIGQIKLFGIFSHWFPCELLVSQNQWSSPSYKKYSHNIGWEVNTIP